MKHSRTDKWLFVGLKHFRPHTVTQKIHFWFLAAAWSVNGEGGKTGHRNGQGWVETGHRMDRNGLSLFNSIHVKLFSFSLFWQNPRLSAESHWSLQNHVEVYRIMSESCQNHPSDSCQNPSDSCRITFFGRNTESHDSCRITKKEGSRIMSQRPNLRPRCVFNEKRYCLRLWGLFFPHPFPLHLP